MSSWRNREPQTANRARGRWRNPGYSSRPTPGPRTISQPSRQMEHIASVSRSSGLEKDGDTLKNFKVQEEYRVFLQQKVDDFFNRHPQRATETQAVSRQRVDAQENILILFRKLREGVSSSRRGDGFALEVYETSLFLSAVLESPKQATSIIPHLLPHLYLTSPPPHPDCLAAVLVSLVHHLAAAYPSQSSFGQLFDTLPSSLLPKDSSAFKWITSISSSLRARNYIKFEILTQRSTLSDLFDDRDTKTNPVQPSSPLTRDDQHINLSQQALHVVVDLLRSKARASSWEVIRSAYRELSCRTETEDWLKRSLFLQPIVSPGECVEVEKWLEQQASLGHVRAGGVPGKWIICQIR